MPRSGLTQRERSVLRCHGLPARDVALALRMRVPEVMEIRAQLRERGISPSTPGLHDPVEQQLSLGDVERMMRDNRAPQPADVEIGWTTGTDPAGW